MNTALGRLALLLALASLPLASRPAAAQAFVVSPTAYNINPVTSNTSQVRFENQGTQPMRFRVEVMRWSTENGAYVYTPTRDVIVNPPEFDLAPGAAQVIRIGVLKKVGGDELTYRVFIRQEPTSGLTPATSDSKDVQIALNNLSTVTLPVYLTPPASAPDVHAHVTGGAAAGLTLQLANAGNRHLTYRQLQAQAGGVSVPLGSAAVLGQSTLLFPLPGLPADTASVELLYLNAAGEEQRETVPVTR